MRIYDISNQNRKERHKWKNLINNLPFPIIQYDKAKD
jgi:hypothetical protein